MAKVFIVRPFGVRQVVKKAEIGTKEEIVNFDFTKVETDLIKPAMEALNFLGGTTGEVFAAGSIIEDMFSELLLSDIVIADITIHNANVFYELGIRHALRDKRTILIKCPGYAETPFDITGFRYLEYKKDTPAKALDALVRTIQETIDKDRKDSPVFNVLPLLVPQDPAVYVAVPTKFLSDLDTAISTKNVNDIIALDSGLDGYLWEIAGRRRIGQALLWNFSIYDQAALVMEKIRQKKPKDTQANDWLSTIYQRLAGSAKDKIERDALLDQSDRAIDILIEQKANLSQYKQAEVFALKARNIKTRWINKWQEKIGIDEKQKTALVSDYILDSYDNYNRGFECDLNHFYSGFNALSLIVIFIELAKIHSATWDSLIKSEEDSSDRSRFLKNIQGIRDDLFVLVNQSIETEIKRVDFLIKSETDTATRNKLSERVIWAKISRADLSFLKSTQIVDLDTLLIKYKKAIDNNIQKFNFNSVITQLRIFSELGIKKEIADGVITSLVSETA